MRYITIFFITCVSLFAQSNIDEDSVHFIGQASRFFVGVELVTEPGFDQGGANWTASVGAPVGWSFNNDAVDCSGAQSVDTILIQGGVTTGTGRVFRIQFEVTAYTAGTVTSSFNGVETGDKSAVGVYTAYVASDGATESISIIGDSSFIGTIDNVSVVAWVGDLDAAGGCTLSTFTGNLLDYMTATGGVLSQHGGLPTENAAGDMKITGIDWDAAQPKVGSLVNLDLSGALLNGDDDGIYKVIAVTETTVTISIDFTTPDDDAITAAAWYGGAYPDIATAINDSTLSEGRDGIYRKRSICVNVDQEVDAVTVFVAETSETTLRENDGSRKIIGFHDSISVVNPGAGGDSGSYGYRVVSDTDFGETYYAGARKAFNVTRSFPIINPNGRWLSWNANDNDINILELNTSNFEMRNIKIFNTIADAGAEGLFHINSAIVNVNFRNCWFAASSRLHVNDQTATGNSIVDCYISSTINNADFATLEQSYCVNSIFDGIGKSFVINAPIGGSFNYCTFYGGNNGVQNPLYCSFSNNIFFDQSVRCVFMNTSSRQMSTFYNNIFSPVAAADIAIAMVTGSSISANSSNNIMYSVSAGAVLTNPIGHNQITPNPPLPVGTIEKDPLFVNPAIGDFRLQASSPALNGGMRSLFDGWTSIGANGPYSSPNAGYRSRYNFKGHNYSDR